MKNSRGFAILNFVLALVLFGGLLYGYGIRPWNLRNCAPGQTAKTEEVLSAQTRSGPAGSELTKQSMIDSHVAGRPNQASDKKRKDLGCAKSSTQCTIDEIKNN